MDEHENHAPDGVAEPALSLDRVRVRYGDQIAVDDVTLRLGAGEILAVLGPSGCGKSTLLRAVAGLEPLAGGQIRHGAERVDTLATHRRGFALMFQDGQLFSHLSVAANIGYPLRLRRTPGPQVRARVDELLDLVGLAGYGGRLPDTLSGGERQRVALARALAVRPRLLLLDEPLSALDAALRERLAEDLRGILARSGTTALMVTHDHEEAFTVADRLAVMRAGRVVQTGPLEAVWRAPVDASTALFLGYARVLQGTEAELVRTAGGAALTDTVPGIGLALRRSALVADPAGALHGVVRQARATPELIRLVVDVAGIGEIDAVTSLGERLGPGAPVRLRVDRDRVAPIQDDTQPSG